MADHFPTYMCHPPFLRHAQSDLDQTWHKHSTQWHTLALNFILRSDQRWLTDRLVAILVVKKTPDVEHVLNHLSDMHLPMLFKLGTQIMNDGLH